MTDVAETVAIGIEEGKVTLKFQQPVQYARFDGNTGRAIGMEIAKLSYELDTGRKMDDPMAGAQVISAEIQNKLQTRLTHVIKNLQEKQRAPGFIAQEVMNIVLREVY